MQHRDNTSAGAAKKRTAYKISLKRVKLAGIMCLALVCVVLIFMSPLFAVKNIVVNPGEYLEAEAVLKAVGFSRGDNIFAIDISSASESVERLDRVGSCTIARTLPGKVTITVNDKVESGYIKVDSGYAGIDEMGKVMIICSEPEQKAPVIKGIKAGEAIRGEYIRSEDKNAKQKMDFLIRILCSLGEHGITSHIKSANLANLDDVTLEMTNGSVVELGRDGKDSNDKVEYKIATLKAILDKDYPKSGVIIDIKDTDNVTARMS